MRASQRPGHEGHHACRECQEGQHRHHRHWWPGRLAPNYGHRALTIGRTIRAGVSAVSLGAGGVSAMSRCTPNCAHWADRHHTMFEMATSHQLIG
jgi:hypothetical protein